MDRTATEAEGVTPGNVTASAAENGGTDAWQERVDRAEEKADQLCRLAEAAQAAIDVLRRKLAEAEAEIDRIGCGRIAVAAELFRQTNKYEVLDGLRKGLEHKCDAVAAEAFYIARDRDRLVDQRAAGLSSLTDCAFDPLFWDPARLGARSTWWGHVPFAHWLVCAAAPEVLVELGTFNGVAYSAFCHAVLRAGLPTRCHAVDTWCGDGCAAGETGDEVYKDFRRFHDQHYEQFSTLLRCSFDTALGRFADGSIDLLNIGGAHSYEAVQHDFAWWLPKLSKQAIIVIHNTNIRDGDFGVWRIWEELRGRYPSFEFLHGHGLGILAVGETAPAAVLALCRLTDPAIALVRSRFALIGERWSQVERLEASESALAQSQAECEELRSQVAALDAEMQARSASLQIELARFEIVAADRARAVEMAENAAALKAGELQRARAEVAALSARKLHASAGSSSRIARSLREAGRMLRSLRLRYAPPVIYGSGPTGDDPNRRP